MPVDRAAPRRRSAAPATSRATCSTTIAELKARLEEIRLAAGPLMNLGDVTKKVVPKMCLVAPPAAGGHHVRRAASSRMNAMPRSASSPRSPWRPPACCRARRQPRVASVPAGREQDAVGRASDRRIHRADRGRRHAGASRSSSAPACCAPRACCSTAWPTRRRRGLGEQASAATRRRRVPDFD